ncbi:hypothetical protein FOZ63_008463 [Perkinsus olseni]|uniref:Uncharacterized protein n=1 Tax=Perkinsus olseni TaxID=32597 RepID=A0A7J6RHS9_PEROL|nr:hypothetical protein FOZ63_008463 [Perkinsus olseni]
MPTSPVYLCSVIFIIPSMAISPGILTGCLVGYKLMRSGLLRDVCVSSIRQWDAARLPCGRGIIPKLLNGCGTIDGLPDCRRIARLLGDGTIDGLLDCRRIDRLLGDGTIDGLLDCRRIDRLLVDRTIDRLLGDGTIDRLLGCGTIDRLLGDGTIDRLVGCGTVDRLVGGRSLIHRWSLIENPKGALIRIQQRGCIRNRQRAADSENPIIKVSIE